MESERPSPPPSSQPPPIPLAASFASPPPPLPPPVIYPQPLPVQSLGYSMAKGRGRPGILTAIAVISIIVACMGAISSLISGCAATGLAKLSHISSAMSTATVATAGSTTTTTTSGPVGLFSSTNVTAVGPGTASAPPAPTQIPGSSSPIVTNPVNGLPVEDRQIASQVLASLQPLSAARAQELDNFLASNGQSVFPTGGRPLKSSAIRAGVTRSGAYPGSGEDDPGYTYFVTGWGTLNIYDDKAAFAPGDASRPPISTSLAADSNANANAMATPVPGFFPLTPTQTQSLAQQVRARTGTTLDPGQTAALGQLLQSPQQQLVPAMYASAPIRRTARQPDGSMLIKFNGGGSVILSPGGVSIKTTNSAAYVPPIFKFNFSPWVSALWTAESFVSAALAVLLLIGAILLLRDAPWGARLHRIFAWIKIPAAIASGIAMSMAAVQFGNGFAPAMAAGPAAGGAASVAGVYIIFAVILTVLALIYPVALLIALGSRTVRDYFNAVA